MVYSLMPYKVVMADEPEINTIPENLAQINAPLFWGNSKGKDVVVAVIDTGLDIQHPDFAGRIVTPANFTQDGDGPADVTDQDGHGTHVAGIIGGAKTGVAPECRIMPIKVFGRADGFQFQEAFRYVWDYNRRAPEEDRVVAVNCSWGGPYDPVVHYFIRELVRNGCAVIVAAGNQGDGNPDTSESFSWPAFLEEVVTVGALDLTGQQPAAFSSSFLGLDLAAPGTSVLSTWPGGGYRSLSGTSMSAPHVTGAYAAICGAWRAREGQNPTEEDGVKTLFRHIKTVDVDRRMVGLGLLDLTWQATRWPLYRVQLGAYFNSVSAKATKDRAAAMGMSTYMVKY